MTITMMMIIITCVQPIPGVSRHGCRQSRPEIIIFDDDDNDNGDNDYDYGDDDDDSDDCNW